MRAFLGLIAASVVAAYLARLSPLFSTTYAAMTLLAGLLFAIRGRQDLVAYCVSYMGATEILWRMTKATIPYEFGKLGTIAILVLSLSVSRPTRLPRAPVLIVMLLMPSVLLLVVDPEFDFTKFRKDVSFYMAGPVALALFVCFFSSIAITREELVSLLKCIVAGTAGVAAAAYLGVRNFETIRFTGSSNVAASGGFGPNQVSTALSMGAVSAILIVIVARAGTQKYKLLYAIISVCFLAHSALTFSRTGVYCAGVSFVAVLLGSVRSPRMFARMTLIVATVSLLFSFVIFPGIDGLTGGFLSRRFRDVNTTGRDQLILSDLRIWASNPLLGVGPGQSTDLHSQDTVFRRGMIGHTEFSRLLAEHGAFGLASMLIMLYQVSLNHRRAITPIGRLCVWSMIAWSMAYMMVSAFRTVAPALMIGLSSATLLPGGDELRRLPPAGGRRVRSPRARAC